MATGVEAAGFVLAAFPLIISALEHYQEGFETLQDWWRFRAEFISFTHSVGIQSVLYTESLEELLRPVVVSDFEMNSLLENPGGTPWNGPDIERRLMERLPKSYDLYRCAINDINQVMEKLKAKLGIKNDQVNWTFDKTAQGRLKWSYEFRRIKFTLSKKKREKLLQTLGSRIEELQKLMGSSDRLAPSRHRRKTSLSQFSQRVRDHACCLYAVLLSGWRCSCRSLHNANLLLEHRFSTDSKVKSSHSHLPEIQFNVLLHFGTGPMPTESVPWTWQETEIRVLEEVSPLPAAQSTSQPQRPRPSATGSQGGRRTSNVSASTSSSSIPRVPKSVNFALDQQSISPSSPSEPDPIAIESVCLAIKQAREGQAQLGLLLDEQNRRYGFRPVIKQELVPDTRERVTLESLLRRDGSNAGLPTSDQNITLSRRERLLVAVILASSLLQLHTTPWISQKWSKRNIFFLRASDSSSEVINVEQLYISPNHESSSDTASEPDQITRTITAATSDSSKSILALGIMLLELCFGQALEDQYFRKEYLGPNGQPNDFTDFATAMKWKDDALGEGGPGFDNAIRRCVLCAFGPKTTDLADTEFREAVYSEVVQPLEETLRCFDSVTW